MTAPALNMSLLLSKEQYYSILSSSIVVSFMQWLIEFMLYKIYDMLHALSCARASPETVTVLELPVIMA